MAFGYFTPPPYEDAEYTVLPGTVVNNTHYSVTALCKGCTYFAPFGNDPTALDPNGENYLAFAYSGVPVDDPSSNETTFGIHERTGHWYHDFQPAQAADFDEWASGSSGGGQTVVVKGMQQGGHPTRALLIPPATPHLLVIQQGSYSNFDYESLNKGVARAVVKVFDLRSVPSGGYTYNTQGWFLGWGLRNEVALAADGNNMIWGVENSGDDFARTVNGRSYDIHNDNPAEELNFRNWRPFQAK
ncbi:Cellobiose dehydrogenase [Colletotrichum sp. SAR 10_86]|nr:Cellobiose dehydrogenase [Colletotrichum sp. SAR 10_86]